MTINLDNTKALERIAGALEGIDKSLKCISKAAADHVSFGIARKVASATAVLEVFKQFTKDEEQNEGNADAE